MGLDSLPLWWVINGLRTANSLLDWLLTYAVHSTILIGGTWLILSTKPGRRLAPASSAWLWRFALVGGIASATIQANRTPDPLGGTMRVPGAAEVAAVHVAVQRLEDTAPAPADLRMPLAQSPGGTLRWYGTTASGDRVTTVVDLGPRWTALAIAVWLLGVVGCLLLFTRARRRFARLLGERRSGEHTLAGGALRSVRRDARTPRRVALTLSGRLTSPVAIGSGEICLPERTLAELDPIRMESILAHELAHLERGDPRWLTLARLIEAILFFQPLNRVARSRMQEAAEFASDEWAARVVARPLDLAHCLARVAEWSTGSSRLLAPAMAEQRGTVLVRRVQRLTSARPVESWGSPKAVRLAAAATVLALVFVAPRVVVGAPVPAPGARGEMRVFQLDSGRAIRIREAPKAAGVLRFSEDVRVRIRSDDPAGPPVRIEARRRR